MNAFITLLARDLRLGLRESSVVGTALGFNLMVVTLLPLGLGPDLALLTRIAPGVLWIALLLSALLSLPRILERDFDDGTLDILALGTLPLELVVAAKACAHWLLTCLPLALFVPLLGVLLNLELAQGPMVVASMLVGTPALSFLGAAGAAMTLRGRRSGLLLAVLVLPLFVPTLVLGISAVSSVGLGSGGDVASLLLLSAISLGAAVVGPVAAAAAIRAQLS